MTVISVMSHSTSTLHPNLQWLSYPMLTWYLPLSQSVLTIHLFQNHYYQQQWLSLAVYDKWLTTETSSIQDQSLAKPLRPSTVIPSIRADTPSTVNPSLLDTLPTPVIPSISIKNLLLEYPVLLVHLFHTTNNRHSQHINWKTYCWNIQYCWSISSIQPTTIIPSISIEKHTAGITSIVGPSLPHNQQPSFPAYQLNTTNKPSTVGSFNPDILPTTVIFFMLDTKKYIYCWKYQVL